MTLHNYDLVVPGLQDLYLQINYMIRALGPQYISLGAITA